MRVNKLVDIIVPNDLVEFRVDLGQKFYTIPSNSAQGLCLFLNGQYGSGTELEFQKIYMSIIKNGYFVVDVGAHFGFYTILAAERVGKSGLVLAFEPSTYNFEILNYNVMINGYSNVKLYNFGLGDTNTVATLGVAKAAKSGENTMAINGDIQFMEKIIIERFYDVYQQERFERVPDLVKIDVEGAELLVLRGFDDLLSRIKCVMCEIHPNKMKKLGTTPHELFELLRANQFKIYLIKDKKLQILDAASLLNNRCHILAINACAKKSLIQEVEKALYKDYTINAKQISRNRSFEYTIRRIIAQLIWKSISKIKNEG